jgi:hypothetical protein
MEVATSEIRIRHKISADCIGAKREFHPQNAPPTQAGLGESRQKSDVSNDVGLLFDQSQ